MKLRSKLIIIMSAFLLLLLFIFSAVTQIFLLNSENSVEKSEITESSINRMNTILQDNYNSLNLISSTLLLDGNIAGQVSNNKAIQTLEIDFISIIDNGTLSYFTTASMNQTGSSIFPEDALSSAVSSLPMPTGNRNTNGILFINGTPYLISAAKVEPGTILVIGKELILAKQSDVSMTVLDAQPEQNNVSPLQSIVIEYIGNHTAVSTMKYQDLSGQKTISFVMKIPRNSFLQERSKVIGFGIVFSVVLIFLTILSLVLIYFSIIKPIQFVQNAVLNIQKDTDGNRLPVKGKDEISMLSGELNAMLDKIEAFNSNYKKSEEKYKLLFEAATQGFWSIDLTNGFITLDSKALLLLDYTNEAGNEFHLADFFKIIHEDDAEHFKKQISQKPSQDTETVMTELRIYTGRNIYNDYFLQGKITNTGRNKIIKISGIITDVTTKKTAEKEMKYLSYYDKTTGLLNRESFNRMLIGLDTAYNLPLSIIFIDVNGLETINEKMGSESGEHIIKMLGNVLKTISGDGIVSRFGYDEFGLILAKTDELSSETICDSIISLINENTKMLNISIGYAIKVTPDQKISDVISLAKERTGRNKLLSEQSKDNILVTNLCKNVTERDFGTENHGKRMYQLCNQIGKKFHLRMYQLDDLSLLSIFHDIGKLDVPIAILAKQGPLTPDELDIIKSHTQKGYEKAMQVPYLKSIAREILYHHENYDGSGYPQGISGDAIPLLSRILRIVDSYDAMTSERPYKRAVSKDDAIKELVRGTGVQYDPALLDIFIKCM